MGNSNQNLEDHTVNRNTDSKSLARFRKFNLGRRILLVVELELYIYYALAENVITLTF